jgi:hypothetical protein
MDGWTPLFRPNDKEEARKARSYWRAVKRHGLYSGSVLGGLSAGDVVGGWLPAAACVALAWFAESKFDSLEDLASDPPRSDFTTIAVPVERRFYPEVLRESQLERALAYTGKSVLSAAAHLRALVRSVERAAGAADRGQADWNSRQLSAARRLKREVALRFQQLPEAGDVLAGQLDSEEELHRRVREAHDRSRLRARSLEESLPTETLALLYRMGVSVRIVREPIGTPKSMDPLEDLSTSLRSATRESAALGARLESWQPALEPPPG